MSKSLGDVLRWFRAVDGTTLGCVALSLPQVTALAAVLDAADAMRRAVGHLGTEYNDEACERLHEALPAYDAARAELAEALKEGR